MKTTTEIERIQRSILQDQVINDAFVNQINMAENIKKTLESIGRPINPVFNVSLLSRTEHHCTK